MEVRGMQAAPIDAGGFREGQRRDWDTASKGWREWNELIDRATRHVSERLVEMAGVQAGHRVLDVAAGYGEPSLTAARRVGPDGSVVATDISAGMLAFGRERADAAGIENVQFIESAASSLDFPERSFDAALSRWGLIFEPDGEGAASRIRSFLKPGARLAISSWGPPDRVPFLALPMMTVMQRLKVPPPPAGTPGPMSRSTPEAISLLLTGGGFSDVEVEESSVTIEAGSPEQYTQVIRDTAPPITKVLEPHPPELQAEVWTAVTEAARQYVGSDGRLRINDNLVLLAAGRA
jgi:SAM-dependent methyltransferase